MARITIEMDRGTGWEIRVDTVADLTVDQVCEQLGAYAVQYPHRAMVDGVVVATAQPVRGKAAGKVTRV